MRAFTVVLSEAWQRRGLLSCALWPLSLLYRTGMAGRRMAYRLGWMRTHRFDVPVIVVGNISIGGTGKTPVVAALVRYLGAQGYRPGIVSRGYGGRARQWPRQVDALSSAEVVGDEPVMLARRTGVPVVVGPDRTAAARELLRQHHCDVVVADDGLQHLALHRDVEIAVVDGERRFGNGFCLPAGPLREPESRLESVDFVIYNGDGEGQFGCRLAGDTAANLRHPERTRPLTAFRDATVHAAAGIGNPRRFFRHLRDAGLSIVEHAFSDHHRFIASDFAFAGAAPVLMTEKDAVKCASFAAKNMWYVPVDAILDDRFYNQLTGKLKAHDR